MNFTVFKYLKKNHMNWLINHNCLLSLLTYSLDQSEGSVDGFNKLKKQTSVQCMSCQVTTLSYGHLNSAVLNKTTVLRNACQIVTITPFNQCVFYYSTVKDNKIYHLGGLRTYACDTYFLNIKYVINIKFHKRFVWLDF